MGMTQPTIAEPTPTERTGLSPYQMFARVSILYMVVPVLVVTPITHRWADPDSRFSPGTLLVVFTVAGVIGLGLHLFLLLKLKTEEWAAIVLCCFIAFALFGNFTIATNELWPVPFRLVRVAVYIAVEVWLLLLLRKAWPRRARVSA
jgi:hypothetical protein